MNPNDADLDELRQRMELLERENERLRRRTEAVFGLDNPNFDVMAFRKAIQFYMLMPWFVLGPFMILVPLSGVLGLRSYVPNVTVGPLPLFDLGGIGTGHPGVGFGVIATGGLACGGIAFGGCAVGVLAFGGGAIGIFAFGGGVPVSRASGRL